MTEQSRNHRWIRAGSAWVALLLGFALAVSFLGWGTSGARSRNSYEVVRSVRTLEMFDGVWATVAPIWFGLPVAVAVGVIFAAMNWPLPTAGVGLAVGLLLIFGWFQVKNSILGVDVGATIGLITGIALAMSSVLLAAFAARENMLRK